MIHPGTQLWGATHIDDDAVIGPDTTLTDMKVGRGAKVIRTHGEKSVIGPDANVGPFTFIRPGTDLGEGGKLGGFVEAKNAQIGRGSKVPHLTYIGDATVGEESNIGASSVFVNYDGVNKHHTNIGSHVRTGSTPCSSLRSTLAMAHIPARAPSLKMMFPRSARGLWRQAAQY